ncbi:MAG TPA: M48 family metallopeptidase [Candidatus Acidoferrales bacterium]|nr:M48 family metallopeptidase [Candidatus Acidoferrales bacterium]
MAQSRWFLIRGGGFLVRSFLGLALAAALTCPLLASPQAPSQPAPPPAQPAPQTAPTAGPQDNGPQPQATPSDSQTSDTQDSQKNAKKEKSKEKKSKEKDAKKSKSDETDSNAQAKEPKEEPPIPQQENPKVKTGSEQDVNAIGNRGVGKGVNFYSLEREMALGKSLAQEVERSSKLIDDPVVSEYVNRVGQNLVRNSDAKVPFTIKVIDSDVVNAFALPGGFFYVDSGLILRADTEAELAGVMAHEIAHVAARHGTKNATKGELAQLATIPLIMLGPGGWAGYGIYEGLNFAIPMSFLKFSRDAEYEADYLGLQYMYAAGYDPNAFVTFFEKVEMEEKRQPGTVPKFFSTHPPTPERVVAIQKEIGNVLPARDQYIVTTSEFDSVKARLRGIENRNKLRDDKTNKDRPTLRTRTERGQPQAGGQQPNAGGANSPSDDPDRPTLKRRPEDDPNGPSDPNQNNQ